MFLSVEVGDEGRIPPPYPFFVVAHFENFFMPFDWDFVSVRGGRWKVKITLYFMAREYFCSLI